MSIPSKYNSSEVEGKWYDYWMKHNYFHSEVDEREPYTIVIPPPNVTGVLHMGHMLNNTIQDVLIRRARLQGKNACWVPGTDHASIATEAKVVAKLKEQGIDANSNDLLAGTYKDITNKITVSCATDGNHGKTVAWGASSFGCNCEIFIHSHVSVSREKEIAKYGANVNRIDGNYDDSVHIADKTAEEKGYFTVSDTSYEGYTEVPKDVMQGYTIMVDEALKQMGEKPTHVFLQGGVGGMAAAVASFILETYQEESPIFVMIEPTNADCLLQSAKNGTPTVVHGDLETVMAGLSCGEISLLAWKILENKTKAFFSIPDEPIAEVMKYLSQLPEPVVAGESAVAGLAGYMITQHSEEYRKALQIDENSKILFLGTEGDTDAVVYEKMVGKSSAEVLKKA